MRRIVPVILVLPIAAVVFMADPIRRADAMIDPAIYAPDLRDADTGAWTPVASDDRLPRAFPPHNRLAETTTRYALPGRSADGVPIAAEAFLRVVVVQDRRDLLAFDPIHAMRAHGWAGEQAPAREGLNRTIHRRGPNPFTEMVTLDTAYVVPGAWGANANLIDTAGRAGPGWPGPGAIVQLLVTETEATAAADDLRALVRRAAAELSESLPGGERP